MKKTKLKISELKIQSFVTSLKKEDENTLKGGDCPGHSDNPACLSGVTACQSAANWGCIGTCGGTNDQLCSTCPIAYPIC